MNTFTATNKPTTANKVQPLNLSDLTTIFGGNDDVINPDDLLGDGNITEDLTNI